MQDRPAPPSDVTVVREADDSVVLDWIAVDAQSGDSYAYWRTDGSSDAAQVTDRTTVVVEGVATDEAPCFIVVTVRSGLSSVEPDSPACLEGTG
jgi:hypothetical protein